jgi:hypothetical protein
MLININILYISQLELKGGSEYGVSVYNLKFILVVLDTITYDR